MRQIPRLLCFITVLLITPISGLAQSEPAPIEGSWVGSLVIGRDSFDMTFNFTFEDGAYKVALISRRLGVYGMPAESVVLKNNRITIRLEILAAEYTGRIRFNESGNAVSFIDGEWFQEGEMVPVILRPGED
jgi:hypothetical protein